MSVLFMNLIDSNYLKKFKEFDNHKLVIKIEDASVNLKGFIAIHNDDLGLPAVGGTRMFAYQSETQALKDVLRLSQAMTYKCAIAKVHFGGGKGVIIGNPKTDKTPNLLKAYAKKINELEGKFYTGEDVGLTENDVSFMLKYSKFFIGNPSLAGDPSPYAALSVFYAMQGAVSFVFNKDSFSGLKVAIKGVGKVGRTLAKLLFDAGAQIYIADIDETALIQTKKIIKKVEIVNPRKIHSLEVDIYSPCALGNEFSLKKAREIKAKIICGGANNQLAEQKVGDWFFRQKIVYVPDYVANAGGLINVVAELEKDGYNKKRVLNKIFQIKKTVINILNLSKQNNKSTNKIADEIAESYFKGTKMK